MQAKSINQNPKYRKYPVLHAYTVLIAFLLYSGGTAVSETAQEYYDRGMMFFGQRDYGSALDSLSRAIESARQSGQLHPRAHLIRAVIYQGMYKDYRQAVLDYKAYLTKPDSDESVALKNLSRAYFDLGLFYRRLFSTAVNIEIDYYIYKLNLGVLLPDSMGSDDIPYLRCFSGFCYYLSGRFGKGIANLSQVSKEVLIHNRAQLVLAACYYSNGQKKEAERIFAQLQRIIDKEADQSQAVMLNSDLWRTYLELGKTEHVDQALQASERALDSFTSDESLEARRLFGRAGRNLSYVHYRGGDIEQALTALEHLDLTIPDSVVPIRATLLKERSIDSEWSDGRLLQTVDVLYYHPSIFQQKSHIYFELARKVYMELCNKLKSSRDRQHAELQIGLCYLYTNQPEEAVPLFVQLQAEVKEELLKARAGIYLGASKYLSNPKRRLEGVQPIWDEILRTHPDSRDIHSEMAYCWAELGINLEACLQLYRKLGIDLPEASEMYTEENRRQHSYFTRQLAYVYLRRGIQEKERDERGRFLTNAVLHLEKCRSEVGYLFDDPVLLVHLAQAYYHKRHFGESGNICQNLLGRYPEVIQILNALQLISEIAIVWPQTRLPCGQMPIPEWIDPDY